MSGFEIAGIVLGAFPIAISALEKYRDIADRLDLFYKIREQYQDWNTDLKFHNLAFTRNLEQLLLPLVADDAKIEELLREPGGDSWKEEPVAKLFEERLQGSYGLYMQYIERMERVMREINTVLAIDSKWTQKLLDGSVSSSQSTFKELFSKEGLAIQVYKFKLCNSDAVRKRLFDEVNECNNKLEKLLRFSDEEVRLADIRETKKRPDKIDTTLCHFWERAKSVFHAMANAWACQCQQHGAKLLLRHRTTKDTHFDILLTGFAPSSRGFRAIRIGDNGDVPVQQVRICLGRTPHINDREILSLCTLFESPEASCYGYLINNEHRHYVYGISQESAKAMPSVTLDHILRGETNLLFTRLQRYTLSLVIASTYLQLLGSPWLPASPNRANIVFTTTDEDVASVKLDEPHLSQAFRPSPKHQTFPNSRGLYRFMDALDYLGIMLLELCFGQKLEEHPWRKGPVEKDQTETGGCDVWAAREWLCHVNNEAGSDYADAVSWCLKEKRFAPPDQWRQDMLRNVIQPLQRSRDYLVTGRVEKKTFRLT
ncbi:hypothetical protein BBK36DRAFT_1165668 [Trichoderma citrinoviride]|uniref:DUF7580 domain-containing protein n=1 Tax=Trichoderma citrinoviride TaxID=58853 RepID=A0A2T4BJB1_9HYPO|nr:hypothetical protein BBK36DRAFT_1165668 [Trichoderma citrinoviride]PTB69395.1 hypothetical protein BBK36DRAFT_1165668 [Trichoderma citrinoviride]